MPRSKLPSVGLSVTRSSSADSLLRTLRHCRLLVCDDGPISSQGNGFSYREGWPDASDWARKVRLRSRWARSLVLKAAHQTGQQM